MNRYPADRYRRRIRSEPYRPEPSVPPFDKLDPGVTELVRLLWIAGFNPTDSGDGVTKPADERSIEGPHVFMVLLEPALVCVETDRLHAFVAEVLGGWLDPIGTPPSGPTPVITLEASYDPATGTAVLTLRGIDDDFVRKQRGGLLSPERRP